MLSKFESWLIKQKNFGRTDLNHKYLTYASYWRMSDKIYFGSSHWIIESIVPQKGNIILYKLIKILKALTSIKKN